MENLKNCINNDLANNYGNLCQRVFTFIKKNCSNKIPKGGKLTQQDNQLINNVKDDLPNLIKLMNSQNLNEYIKRVVSFSFDANKYFNDSQPWAVKKNDLERMNTILNTIVQQIKNISILLSPIIPISAKKVFNTINLNEGEIKLENILNSDLFNHDKELKDLKILFRKIENDN